MDRLCYRAAAVFAKWVWDGPVLPNGHNPAWQIINMSDFRVNLAMDEVKERAYGG
jgi:hypothetical protein